MFRATQVFVVLHALSRSATAEGVLLLRLTALPKAAVRVPTKSGHCWQLSCATTEHAIDAIAALA